MSEFDDMMRFDPLDVAQRVTGGRYDTDADTRALGFDLVQRHAAHQREELALRDDTYADMPFEDALRVLGEEGFEVVYAEDFIAPAHAAVIGSEDRVERFVVAFCRAEGIIATADSIKGEINSLSLYYQWEHFDRTARSKVTASGHYCRDESRWVWIGSHELHRGGLRHTLAQLRDQGSFLPVWMEPAHLWLTHYGHRRSSTAPNHSPQLFTELDDITKDVLAKLPDFVQEAIKLRFRN